MICCSTAVRNHFKYAISYKSCSYASKFFHNWVPGRVFSPAPLKYIDLHEAYHAALVKCIKSNLVKLRPALHVNEGLKDEKAVKVIVKELMRFESEEVNSVIQSRLESSKQVNTHFKEYAVFLNEMFSRNPCERRILRILKSFPNGMTAENIEPSHLETLINFSMKKPELCVNVFDMLQRSGLPTTSREQAMFVYHTFQIGGDWRSALAKWWPKISEKKDTGAFNTLLKLGLRAKCANTQSLVRHYHLNPDRFTYFIQLRNLPFQPIFREFNEKHFVIDVAIASSVLSSMLKSRYKTEVSLAEQKFEQLLATSKGIKPIYMDSNKLSIQLKALDRVSQLLKGAGNISLPRFVDSVLLQRMYSHYISTHNHSAALNVAMTIAQQGDIIPRHLIYSHLKDATSADAAVLEQLFYLCCDMNSVHPGFISKSLANAWASKIAHCSGMQKYDASALVEKYCITLTL